MRLIITVFTLILCININAQETTVFEYSGEVETYLVPECVTQLNITIQGAAGGGDEGGDGSTISGILNVTEGQILEIRVGGMGNCPEGGFNGGGEGGNANQSSNDGCGGGGASDIRTAPYSLTDRIIVASGGGGMGGGDTDASGGNAGCENGGDGNSPFGVGGYGASGTAGGNGGPAWITAGSTGGDGTLAIGGTGAIDPCYDLGAGGGGGGGFYGGGGGGSDCFDSSPLGGGGGGGGSCLIPEGFSCDAGNVNSNGYVSITPVEDFSIQATPSSVNYCQGDSVLLTLTGANEYLWSPNSDFESISDSEFYVSTDSTTTYTIIGSTDICSDTVEVQINVQASFSSQSTVELCSGESYTLPDGSEVNSPGVYPVVFSTENFSCDSVITTEITFTDSDITEQSHNICDGETITLPDGTTVNEGGTYPVTLSSLITGCDSTIVSEVNIAPSYDLDFDISTCDDGSYYLPDGTLPITSGVYEFIYETVSGCDSLVSIDVLLNPEYFYEYSDEICQGEVCVLPDGNTTGNEGTYTSVFQSTTGCDSVITVHVTVNNLPEIDLGIANSYCLNEGNITTEPQPVGGNLIGDLVNGLVLEHEDAPPGVYDASYTYTDSNGCTSTESQEYIIPNPIEPEMSYDILCHDLHFECLNCNSSDEVNWYLGENLVAVEPEFIVAFYEYGDFDLELSITDEFSCEYSSSEAISLQFEVDFTGFFVPNVITPNEDYYNEKLKLPNNFTACVSYSMKIYNKWGLLVYEMTEGTPEFAGRRHNGDQLPEGVYYYTLEVVDYPCQETPELMEWCSGSITIFHD